MMQSSENVYEKLVKTRLQKKQLDVLDVIGILCVFIISRTYIKSNTEVAEMIGDVLEENLPRYVVKSRTLMAAKACRIILNSSTLDMAQIQSKMKKILIAYETLSLKVEDNKEKPKKLRKENENTKLEKWLKGLGNAE